MMSVGAYSSNNSRSKRKASAASPSQSKDEDSTVQDQGDREDFNSRR